MNAFEAFKLDVFGREKTELWKRVTMGASVVSGRMRAGHLIARLNGLRKRSRRGRLRRYVHTRGVRSNERKLRVSLGSSCDCRAVIGFFMVFN